VKCCWCRKIVLWVDLRLRAELSVDEEGSRKGEDAAYMVSTVEVGYVKDGQTQGERDFHGLSPRAV
jgi:hypothetical protein